MGFLPVLYKSQVTGHSFSIKHLTAEGRLGVADGFHTLAKAVLGPCPNPPPVSPMCRRGKTTSQLRKKPPRLQHQGHDLASMLLLRWSKLQKKRDSTRRLEPFVTFYLLISHLIRIYWFQNSTSHIPFPVFLAAPWCWPSASSGWCSMVSCSPYLQAQLNFLVFWPLTVEPQTDNSPIWIIAWVENVGQTLPVN